MLRAHAVGVVQSLNGHHLPLCQSVQVVLHIAERPSQAALLRLQVVYRAPVLLVVLEDGAERVGMRRGQILYVAFDAVVRLGDGVKDLGCRPSRAFPKRGEGCRRHEGGLRSYAAAAIPKLR